MNEPVKPKLKARSAGAVVALSGHHLIQLLMELRLGSGPVNLAGTARKYGISRGTLLKYIKDDRGLEEAIEARRAEAGRGYVTKIRGTRATRAAAKIKLQREREVAPPRMPAPPIPAYAQRVLDQLHRDQDAWDSFIHPEGDDCRADLKARDVVVPRSPTPAPTREKAYERAMSNLRVKLILLGRVNRDAE